MCWGGQVISGEGVHSSKDLLLFLGGQGSDVISPPPRGWLFSWRNRSTAKANTGREYVSLCERELTLLSPYIVTMTIWFMGPVCKH